jgi:hypothetical protein
VAYVMLCRVEALGSEKAIRARLMPALLLFQRRGNCSSVFTVFYASVIQHAFLLYPAVCFTILVGAKIPCSLR